MLFLGRGATFPIAMEGALKLKEISYIHAEGYAAGEIEHGPIALIDDQVPVIVLCPESPCSRRPRAIWRRPRPRRADLRRHRADGIAPLGASPPV